MVRKLNKLRERKKKRRFAFCLHSTSLWDAECSRFGRIDTTNIAGFAFKIASESLNYFSKNGKVYNALCVCGPARHGRVCVLVEFIFESSRTTFRNRTVFFFSFFCAVSIFAFHYAHSGRWRSDMQTIKCITTNTPKNSSAYVRLDIIMFN